MFKLDGHLELNEESKHWTVVGADSTNFPIYWAVRDLPEWSCISGGRWKLAILKVSPGPIFERVPGLPPGCRESFLGGVGH